MNTSTPKVPFVVLIVALLLSIWMSNGLARLRGEQGIQASQKAARLGFAKFLSQIGWMRILQYRGTVDKITAEDAARLLKKYDSLTDLDPLFAKAYEEGALDIGFESPEDALRLLDKAMAVNRLDNWRIPFTAGFIARQRLKDNERALRYYEMAARAKDAPEFVDRAVLHVKAERLQNDPMQMLLLWAEYYLGGPEALAMDENAAAVGPGRFVEGGGYSLRDQPQGAERSFAVGRISHFSEQIVTEATRELSAEADAAQKKKLEDRIAQTQKIVKRVFGNSHICAHCFRPYSAGDRFCAYDGKPVEVFGVCPKDGETIVHGAYCQKCGAKVN